MNDAIFPELIWLGTNHSLDVARDIHGRLMAGTLQAGMFDQDDKTEDKPFNYSLQGDVGIISITGSLTNKDAWYNRYLGITSYNDIRVALDFAARDASAKEILLYIDSGGGSVAGVSDTAELIKQIDAKVKPVYSFSDGVMASAAYWLGSSARKVYNSDTALMGSIGVIMTHLEYSKQLKDAGIGVNVLRAGEFKALLNSYEPATKVALEQAGEQLAAAYDIFLTNVAANRGVSKEVVDTKMAQGREFFGAKAVEAGLSDGVLTLDKMVSKMQQRIDKAATPSSNPNNLQNGLNPMKRAMTEQDIAALAAGAPALAASVQPTEPEVEQPAAGAAAAPEAADDKPAAVTESQEKKDDGVLAYVQGQLSAAQSEVVDLKVQIKSLEGQLASMKGTHDKLLAIAGGSLRNMKIALNAGALDVSAMSAEAVLAEHEATAKAFHDKFKAGGVAAASDKDAVDSAQKLDPHRMQRIKATSLKK